MDNDENIWTEDAGRQSSGEKCLLRVTVSHSMDCELHVWDDTV